MTGEVVLFTAESLPLPLAGIGELVLPATIAREGDQAARRYIEFFTARPELR